MLKDAHGMAREAQRITLGSAGGHFQMTLGYKIRGSGPFREHQYLLMFYLHYESLGGSGVAPEMPVLRPGRRAIF